MEIKGKQQKQKEIIVNQFEVEELEDRLENKWGEPDIIIDFDKYYI